nr:MAG TPA: hypothetical protein [Caudoviricetes sp.]
MEVKLDTARIHTSIYSSNGTSTEIRLTLRL